jgi:cyclohexane-1-carbonyl-CoA dehydrogenase
MHLHLLENLQENGMDQISEEQKIMLNNLRRAVKEKVSPLAAENDRTGRFNPEIASLFWDLGLLEIMLPEEYGGWPHNPSFTLCLAIEEIAKACAASALLLIIQAVGSYPLIFAGNHAQKKSIARCSRHSGI